MALRNIRINDDPILRKKSRDILEINDRIKELSEDMLETMYHENGVGLAAPQVGILRKIVVIDIGEGPITLINPIILNQEGMQVNVEGCLSVPGVNEKVERPSFIKIKYQDIDGKENILEGENLLAVAISHELDHLKGILFIDKAIKKEKIK
ncbi:MAG: peptide deformylase [Eubacteriaceae bacterium]